MLPSGSSDGPGTSASLVGAIIPHLMFEFSFRFVINSGICGEESAGVPNLRSQRTQVLCSE